MAAAGWTALIVVALVLWFGCGVLATRIEKRKGRRPQLFGNMRCPPIALLVVMLLPTDQAGKAEMDARARARYRPDCPYCTTEASYGLAYCRSCGRQLAFPPR